MTIGTSYLAEPKLQFGSCFEHEDSKTGLAEYGPFGKEIPGLHPSEIKVGFVGTRETIELARGWIDECGGPIESENRKKITPKKSAVPAPNVTFGAGLFDDEEPDFEDVVAPDPIAESFIRIYKIHNRDFIGFSKESMFDCEFQTNERWERVIQPHEIDQKLGIEDKQKRILELVDLFDEQIRSLAQTKPSPDIIVLVLPQRIVEEAHAVRITGNFFLNFRRAVKARAMRWGVPIQLIQQNTILGKAGRRKKPLQEKAARAWNFCAAQYYKADGVLWRPLSFQQETLYVGIDFFVAREVKDTLTMRSSVAQAFDHLGQGLVLRGDPFEWDEDKQGRTPHLTKEGARKLIASTLKEYILVKRTTPKRVVIHKSSRFWGTEHGEYNELDGFQEGIREVFTGIEIDLVALAQSGVRLFREGIYPPLRGTVFNLDDDYFIYTMGYIPFLATYPGHYPPDPWRIVQHVGGSGKPELCREILELTKMNVNNCHYADGTPITLSFSHMVGEIMKHIPEDRAGDLKTAYKHYM